MKVGLWIRNYRWLMAFLIPQAIIIVSWAIRRQGWLAPDIWRMIEYGALLFVVLGLAFVYGWKLTDVGVKRQRLLVRHARKYAIALYEIPPYVGEKGF